MNIAIKITNLSNKIKEILFPFKQDNGNNDSRKWPINLELKNKEDGNIYHTPLFTNYPSANPIPPAMEFTVPEKKLRQDLIKSDNTNGLKNVDKLYLFNKEPKESEALINQVEINNKILNNYFSITLTSGAGTASHAGSAGDPNHKKHGYIGTNYYGQPQYGDISDPIPEDPSRDGTTGQAIEGTLKLDFFRLKKTLVYRFCLPGGAGGLRENYRLISGEPGKTVTIKARETCNMSLIATVKTINATYVEVDKTIYARPDHVNSYGGAQNLYNNRRDLTSDFDFTYPIQATRKVLKWRTHHTYYVDFGDWGYWTTDNQGDFDTEEEAKNHIFWKIFFYKESPTNHWWWEQVYIDETYIDHVHASPYTVKAKQSYNKSYFELDETQCIGGTSTDDIKDFYKPVIRDNTSKCQDEDTTTQELAKTEIKEWNKF